MRTAHSDINTVQAIGMPAFVSIWFTGMRQVSNVSYAEYDLIAAFLCSALAAAAAAHGAALAAAAALAVAIEAVVSAYLRDAPGPCGCTFPLGSPPLGCDLPMRGVTERMREEREYELGHELGSSRDDEHGFGWME